MEQGSNGAPDGGCEVGEGALKRRKGYLRPRPRMGGGRARGETSHGNGRGSPGRVDVAPLRGAFGGGGECLRFGIRSSKNPGEASPRVLGATATGRCSTHPTFGCLPRPPRSA